MRKTVSSIIVLLLLLTIGATPLLADSYLENLKPNQEVDGFKVLNLYDNRSDAAMGARFISVRHGFIVDLMRIQSVPQGFFWIKTPPTSSKGEPHACEHLLLGKGNRGRYVAALEDMALGNSSAYTSQIRTCYHFNTTAGEKTFYQIFEAKLQAFLHPDFTDEEVRREVCNVGVAVNPEDSSLSLEEKGTVYTEMVSSFEKPWYYLSKSIGNMVYGPNHPLTYVSGGDPDAMRTMVPADMWRFHKETYHLSNMGVIVAIPDQISVPDFLKQMNAILDRCQSNSDSSPLVGIGAYDLPPAHPAAEGSVKLATYPSDKLEDPGNMIFEWPADIKLTPRDRFLLELFISNFSDGETSNLYDLFINSQTRKLDVGGQGVYGGLDTDLDGSVYFGLSRIDNKFITEAWVDSIRAMVVNELQRVHDFAPGSPELKDFNDKAEGRLLELAKQYDNYLNSPPMFGFRSGTGGGWLSLMETLEKDKGFRKSLVMKPEFAFVDSLLASKGNLWTGYIDKWQLLSEMPYAAATAPSSDMLKQASDAKTARLTGYVNGFEKKYGVNDAQEAIALYKKDFDAKTAELDSVAGKQTLPGFIDNPPMTLDDQLKYEVVDLPNGVPLVASTFDNMTSSEVGIALRLDVIPESLLVYVPALRSVLTDIGVTMDGKPVSSDEMRQRLREEVLSLNAGFDYGFQTQRVELVLTGRGSKLAELKNALKWMDAALYSPLLTKENLPRMLDLVDQALNSYRNRTKSPEEYWVSYPVYGYRFQQNPLMMSTNCFLTQTHELSRVKWQLTDPGNDQDKQEIISFLDALSQYGQGKSRDEINTMLTAIENQEQTPDEVTLTVLKVNFVGLSDLSRKNASEIANSLRLTLGDIPDADLPGDWNYLCNEIKQDLLLDPDVALGRLNYMLSLIRKPDNARMFMISNSHDRAETMPLITSFANKLDDSSPSVRQQYAKENRVINRLRDREPDLDKPLYVGLVHEGSRNGVLVFSARASQPYDTSTDVVLSSLSGKLYGGGGPHGLFMKTWAAGLAYSNGYSNNAGSGRVGYYAERCPDVAATMRFVVGQLKNAEDDPGLTDYAIAQEFGYSRAPSRYEDRGQAMASDLADGITPDVVRLFRQKVLDLRNMNDLYDQLKSRMPQAYGQVLIGYGPQLSQSKDATFFLIGPETQFKSLQDYIGTAEGKQEVHRLYPRDFWLTM